MNKRVLPLAGRQSTRTFCAVACALVVGVPSSIYEQPPPQFFMPALAAVEVDASTPQQTQLDLEEQIIPDSLSSGFPGKKPMELDASEKDTEPQISAAPKHVDDVRQYLWEVYKRSRSKLDSTGDFTWKDAAAAARLRLSLEEYVIGGMDPDFREQLFAVGRAMDDAGIDWTILSAFRDDYRQSLAVGFKAHAGNSFHGGTAATGGYGHGCAVDLAGTDSLLSETVWNWIDQHGQQFGLHRPLRRLDPAHVQPTTGWHRLAGTLRQERVGIEAALTSASADGDDPISPLYFDISSKDSVTEEQFSCIRPHVAAELPQREGIVRRLNSIVAHVSLLTAERNRPQTKWKTAGQLLARRMSLRRTPADHSRQHAKWKGAASRSQT